jgi:hypothetical protein
MKRITVIAGEVVPPEHASRLIMQQKVVDLRGDKK